jgi:translocation and assembly module TamA
VTFCIYVSPSKEVKETALFFGLLAAIFSFLVASSSAAYAQEEADRWAYDTVINLPEDETLSELLELSSQMYQLKDKPPVSLAALRRRIDADLEGFKKVMNSEGYYSARVTYDVDPSVNPVLVTFNLDPGPRYTIGAFRVEFDTLQTSPGPLDPKDLGIDIGAPAVAQPIVDAQKKAISLLANRGYPLAQFERQNAVVDYTTRQMQVVQTIKSGPLVYFGKLELTGLEQINKAYLLSLSGWKENVIYQEKTLKRVRQIFLETGLFDVVRYSIPKGVTYDAVVPVTFEFEERKHRSIGVGADYSTSDGAGISAYWENRNFFGQGEKLRGDLRLSEITQEVSASFVKPNVYRRHQNLKAEASLRIEDTDAYSEEAARVYVGLDRTYGKNWTVGGGAFFELSQIEENGVSDDFFYFGVPITAAYDSTDDLLDPSKGFRFSTTLTSYLGLNDVSSDFVKTDIEGSGYYSALADKRLIFAARARVGSIVGSSRADVPAVKRFYSGGGGSIRGYELQSVGPLDDSNDPIGGRSVVEVGLEARIRITEAIGIVPFIEGGNVYKSMMPDFDEEFRWAAGLGARYYTPFGPLRLDVALPLNRRANKDDAFQFYISIGQAF